MAVYIHYDADIVKNLAEKTNLTPLVVSELLSKGWRYVERVGEISRWEHPMWNLSEKPDSMYEVLSQPAEDPSRPGYDFEPSPYPKQYAPRPSGSGC